MDRRWEIGTPPKKVHWWQMSIWRKCFTSGIRELQMKSRYCPILTRIAGMQNTVIPPKSDRNVEQQEVSFTDDENTKWCSHFGRLLVSYKIKHVLPVWSSSYALWHIAMWIKNLSTHKSLHMGIYSNFIYEDLEATKMSFSWWVHKLICPEILLCERLFSVKKKRAIKPWRDTGIFFGFWGKVAQ